jgi:tetratricopeptide (TPR) repeat protein
VATVAWRAALSRDSTSGTPLATWVLTSIGRRGATTADGVADLHAACCAWRLGCRVRLFASRSVGRVSRLAPPPFPRAFAAIAEALFARLYAAGPSTDPARDHGYRVSVRPARDADIAALGHCVRVGVYAFAGASAAREEAATGIALARQAGSRRGEAACLAMLGQYSLAVNDLTGATAAYDSAIALAERARDGQGAATAYWGRGNFRLEHYDHDGASSTAVFPGADDNGSGTVGVVELARAFASVVSWHFADMVSARQKLACVLAREIGDGWALGYSRYLEGSMALEAGQVDAAEAAFREDLEWATQSRQPLEQFSARFGLARAAASRADWAAAQSQFDAATRVARDNNLVGYLPQLDYEYGMIALRSGNLPEADRRFRRLRAPHSGVSDLDRYAAGSRIAEIFVMRGETIRRSGR